MGCMHSVEAQESIQRNRSIDKELNLEKNNKVNKLLLLGTGGSGKSTFLKQIRYINGQKPSEEEIVNLINQVKQNVRIALAELREFLCSAEFSEKCEISEDCQKIIEIDPTNVVLSKNLTSTVCEVINLPHVKEYLESLCPKISESTPYFLQNFERIVDDSYTPTEQDTCRIRVKTTGIVEIHLEHNGMKLKICDVGGQRSERRKWIAIFDDVILVIFLCSLADYNCTLVEDQKTNSLVESFNLFETLCKNKVFEKTSFIIILNKTDVFKVKIKHDPLTTCFPEYNGENDYRASANFIKQKFLDISQRINIERNLYFYETCATDTESVRVVFSACSDILVQANLEDLGFG